MYARTFFFLSHLPLIFSLTYRSEKSFKKKRKKIRFPVKYDSGRQDFCAHVGVADEE
jgi:hypothetical protein